MSDYDARALLWDALDLFNDHPRFSLRGDRRRTSYTLAAQIEAYLESGPAPHPAIAIARERWSSAGFLRIDDDETTVTRDGDGIWIRSWVRVELASLGEIAPQVAVRYEAAVRSLPEKTRTMFVIQQREGLSVSEIARRLQITSADVERHIGEALASIASALDRADRD